MFYLIIWKNVLLNNMEKCATIWYGKMCDYIWKNVRLYMEKCATIYGKMCDYMIWKNVRLYDMEKCATIWYGKMCDYIWKNVRLYDMEKCAAIWYGKMCDYMIWKNVRLYDMEKCATWHYEMAVLKITGPAKELQEVPTVSQFVCKCHPMSSRGCLKITRLKSSVLLILTESEDESKIGTCW